MSKFAQLEGQNIVVESIVQESISKSGGNAVPVSISEFNAKYKPDTFIRKPNEEAIKNAEKELGVTFGPQLKKYLLTYGGISYKFVEFEGLAATRVKSDIVQRTLNARELGLDKKYIVILKIHDEGLYAVVDSKDNVYEFDSALGSKKYKDMKMKFEDYFIWIMKYMKVF